MTKGSRVSQRPELLAQLNITYIVRSGWQKGFIIGRGLSARVLSLGVLFPARGNGLLNVAPR